MTPVKTLSQILYDLLTRTKLLLLPSDKLSRIYEFKFQVKDPESEAEEIRAQIESAIKEPAIGCPVVLARERGILFWKRLELRVFIPAGHVNDNKN